MPNPRKGESKDEFISRCIVYVKKHEGVKSSGHAYKKCEGLWKKSKKGK